jgi:hypothetical protein
MNPKITSDIEQALRQQPDGRLRIEGPDGTVFWVVTDQAMHTGVVDEFIRQQVQAGLAQAEAGELEPFDMEAIKAKARKQYTEPTDT